MLAAQAVYASALFLGKVAEKKDIERAYASVYNAKRNIILTGMPSSGKSSVGRALAERTGKKFFDSDSIIVKKIGMPIAGFFAERGEAEFRRIEHEVIAELSKESGAVIATGGGAVLDGENVKALKRNGTVVFLDRSPEKLFPSEDRPLSSDIESLMRRYNERYNIYISSADVAVDGNGSIGQTAELVNRETAK